MQGIDKASNYVKSVLIDQRVTNQNGNRTILSIDRLNGEGAEKLIDNRIWDKHFILKDASGTTVTNNTFLNDNEDLEIQIPRTLTEPVANLYNGNRLLQSDSEIIAGNEYIKLLTINIPTTIEKNGVTEFWSIDGLGGIYTSNEYIESYINNTLNKNFYICKDNRYYLIDSIDYSHSEETMGDDCILSTAFEAVYNNPSENDYYVDICYKPFIRKIKEAGIIIEKETLEAERDIYAWNFYPEYYSYASSGNGSGSSLGKTSQPWDLAFIDTIYTMQLIPFVPPAAPSFPGKTIYPMLGTAAHSWQEIHGISIYGNEILPNPNSYKQIGASDNYWTNIYGTNIYGTIINSNKILPNGSDKQIGASDNYWKNIYGLNIYGGQNDDDANAYHQACLSLYNNANDKKGVRITGDGDLVTLPGTAHRIMCENGLIYATAGGSNGTTTISAIDPVYALAANSLLFLYTANFASTGQTGSTTTYPDLSEVRQAARASNRIDLHRLITGSTTDTGNSRVDEAHDAANTTNYTFYVTHTGDLYANNLKGKQILPADEFSTIGSNSHTWPEIYSNTIYSKTINLKSFPTSGGLYSLETKLTSWILDISSYTKDGQNPEQLHQFVSIEPGEIIVQNKGFKNKIGADSITFSHIIDALIALGDRITALEGN